MTSEVVENTGESSFGEAQDEAGAARIGAGFVGGGSLSEHRHYVSTVKLAEDMRYVDRLICRRR